MNKLVDIEYLKNTFGNTRQNKVIVQCHGVFDLLHVGHIRYFQEAKSKGDILVVTITPDRFVNKGPGRPVFNEKLRAEAISALDIVDYVAINEWPTAVEVIKVIKPDLYVKGPDYQETEADITGNIRLEERAVKSVGGEIAFTTGVTFSSSTLINQELSVLNKEQKDYIERLKQKYSFDQITKFIDRLKKLKVLLVGESIIDEYVFCNAVGKSGKEPVLVTQRKGSEKYPGGILAIANHITDFCKEGYVYSCLGDRNDHRKFIIEHLAAGINYNFLVKTDSPTIIKTRYVDSYSNTKVFGVYDINDDPLNTEDEAKFCNGLEKILPQFDLVITADYGHGIITEKVVKLVQKKSRYLAVNTQLNSFNLGYHSISKYTKTDYVCVHEGELRHDYRNRTDKVESLVVDLSNKLNADTITITRGVHGSLGYNRNKFTK